MHKSASDEDPGRSSAYGQRINEGARRGTRVWLLPILLASWALLVWQLSERSLWADEFGTFQMIQGTVLDAIRHAAADIHPPLYFAVLNIWTAMSGDSDFALRWLSTAFGLVAVALIPALARELRLRNAVVPGTLLFGLSPALIEFSRMTRYYSLALMLGVLSTVLLLRATRSSGWRAWLAYSIAAAALAYTFYPAVVLLATHALLGRSQWRSWLRAGLVSATLFLPWLVLSVGRQVISAASYESVDFARSLGGIALAVLSCVYTFSVGEAIFPWRPEAWLSLVLIALLLARTLARRSRAPWQLFVIFALSTLALAILTTYLAVGTPFLNVPVRALFALPFYMLLIASAIASFASRRIQFLLIAPVIFVDGISVYNYFTGREYLNPIYLTPAKEAAEYVHTHASASDFVFSDFDSVFGRYYVTSATRSYHRYTDQVEDIGRIISTSRPARIWLVVMGRDRTEILTEAPRIRTLLLANYKQVHLEKFLTLDPVYLQVKNFLLRRDTYQYRLGVELYELSSS